MRGSNHSLDVHPTLGERIAAMQRSTLFTAKLLLPYCLVLVVIYPFNPVYAQEKIRIGISSSSPGFLPTVVAEQRGYFSKYGLASEHIRISLAVAINALSTGDLDYAITIA